MLVPPQRNVVKTLPAIAIAMLAAACVVDGADGQPVVTLLGPGPKAAVECVSADQFMGDASKYANQVLDLHGRIAAGSVQRKKGTTDDLRFIVEYNGQRLPVHFTNIPPDNFQEEGEVVLTGNLNADGVFESDAVILGRCFDRRP